MIAMKQSHHLRAILFALITIVALTSGCDSRPDFTYGKAADQSVNGVSVFANLLRERGHAVWRKRRLTKRLDKFDTLIWAPDNSELPPENVVAWLEKWLAQSPTRVLIFVGRSYDGKLPFHRSMVEVAPIEERENWQRELNDILVNESSYNGWLTNFNGDNDPFWFEADKDLRINTSKLEGPWAEGINSRAVELDCETLLRPMPDYNEGDAPELAWAEDSAYSLDYWDDSIRDEYLEVNDLLTVDGKSFAFEVSSIDEPNRKIIVISNGSFLLNFPLTNAEHRKLATKVADEVRGDVVFLESNYRWPTIGGQANDPALQWTWVGQAPMNYIVPHFLFWGVLYCFVFFPNFGRPKRIQFHPPKAFRSHVKAVALILGRSKEKNWAREVIDTWLKRNKKQ